LFLFNELLDSLQGFISLLHTEKGLLPVIQKSFLGHDDLLNLNRGFLECVPGSSCLFLLRDELGLVKGLLLIQPFDFFVHRVNQNILILLLLFKIDN
jgi:hypothetical protein